MKSKGVRKVTTVCSLRKFNPTNHGFAVLFAHGKDFRDASVDDHVEVWANEGLCDVRRRRCDPVAILNLHSV